MIDIEKFVTIGEDGKLQFDKDGYQSAYDSELRQRMETSNNNYKKKLTDEIRKQLEEEAKLSAEEKLKQEREVFEQEKIDFYRASAQSTAKSKMTNSQLFDEDEMNTMLDLVSTNDDIAKIDKIIASRQKAKDSLEQKLKSELVSSQPNPQDGNDTQDNSLGARMAKQYQNKGVDAKTPKVTAFGD